MSRSAAVLVCGGLGIVSVAGLGGCASANLSSDERPLHVVRHDEQAFFGAGDSAGYALFSHRGTGRVDAMALAPIMPHTTANAATSPAN